MKKILLSLVMVAFASAAFAQLTAHVKFVDDATTPWVWAWDGTVGSKINYSGGAWPGVEATGPDADGYFSFEFPADVTALPMIIFSNGNGMQTIDIAMPATDEYYNVDLVNTIVVGTDTRASYTTGKVATALTSVSANSNGVTVSGSSIKVANGSAIEIVNIGGVTVQSAVSAGEFESQPLSAGLYIVVVDGVATKVLVK